MAVEASVVEVFAEEFVGVGAVDESVEVEPSVVVVEQRVESVQLLVFQLEHLGFVELLEFVKERHQPMDEYPPVVLFVWGFALEQSLANRHELH